MNIFLSYASEDRNTAERVSLALVGCGHDVFFDQTNLSPAGDYNSRIRQAILASNLFIFLISPNSVEESAYALTELKFAREKWRHPRDHVLPVVVRPTEFTLIPNYLKAVTILEPSGDAAAEVSAWVSDRRISRDLVRWIKSGRLFSRGRLALILAALGFAATIVLSLNIYRHEDAPLAIPGPERKPSNLNEAQYDSRRTLREDGKPYRNGTQEAQFLLKTLGYEIGSPDGFEGPLTTAAIEDFQRKHNLPVSGAADDATLMVIRSRAQKTFLQKTKER